MDAFHLLLYEEFEISDSGHVNFTELKARLLDIDVLCVLVKK